MKTQRRFRPGFKRQVVEELLSGISFAAQIIRRDEISSGPLCHWKRQYAQGAFEIQLLVIGREWMRLETPEHEARL